MNIADMILSIFLKNNSLIVPESEIKKFSMDEKFSEDLVKDELQLLTRGLLERCVQYNGTIVYMLKPKISICDGFRNGHCRNPPGKCFQLHICRYTLDCRNKNCQFPHDFKDGKNKQIVENVHCERIDPTILIRILKLHQSTNKMTASPRSPSPLTPAQPSINATSNQLQDNTVKFSVSVNSQAEKIDEELLNLTLSAHNFRVKNISFVNQDALIFQGTIELQSREEAQKLLLRSDITIGPTVCQFKPFLPPPARSSFVIEVQMNPPNTIEKERLKLYCQMLCGSPPHDLINVSAGGPLLILVIYSNNLDIAAVKTKSQQKPQLKEKPVRIMEIREVDTILLTSLNYRQPITLSRVQTIVGNIGLPIFLYKCCSDGTAEIEFLSHDDMKSFLPKKESIETAFGISIQTKIIPSEEPNELLESCKSLLDILPEPEAISIKLNDQWVLVLRNPRFRDEYQQIIQQRLQCQVKIEQDEVIVDTRGAASNRIDRNRLMNETKNFMGQFTTRTLHHLKYAHWQVINDHKKELSYRRLPNNEILLLTRTNDMHRIFSAIFKPDANPSRPPSPKPNPLLTGNHAPAMPLMGELMVQSEASCRLRAEQEIDMFQLKDFEKKLGEELSRRFSVKISSEKLGEDEQKSISIKIIGRSDQNKLAMNFLENLLSKIRKKTYEERTDGLWTKMLEAIALLQNDFLKENILIYIRKIPKNMAEITYFQGADPPFNTNIQEIENIIKLKYRSAFCQLNSKDAPAILKSKWLELEAAIRKRDYYKKSIVMLKVEFNIYLFGLPASVKEVKAEFESLKQKLDAKKLVLQLSDKQVKYLLTIVPEKLEKLKSKWREQGYEFTLVASPFESSISGPQEHLHSVKDALIELCNVQEKKFSIPGFVLAKVMNKDPNALMGLVQSKCILDFNIQTVPDTIQIPSISGPGRSAYSLQDNATELQVDNSLLKVTLGDLARENVDMIVVNSGSEYLRKAILHAAGPRAVQEFESQRNSKSEIMLTTGDQLPCKKILFVYLTILNSNDQTTRDLKKFVETALQQAVENNFTSIAFPSVGCGKFNMDAKFVSKILIKAAADFLKHCPMKLLVSFVVIPNQKNVFDAFTESLQSISTSLQSSTGLLRSGRSLQYTNKMTTISLFATSPSILNECENRIKEYVAKITETISVEDSTSLANWTESILESYYRSCIEVDVIPNIDLGKHTVTLVGLKENIATATIRFHEYSTKLFKEAHMKAITESVVWSFEKQPNTGDWQQYSFVLNGIIENGYRNHLIHVDITNDELIKCRIDYTAMTEISSISSRSIRRRAIHSTLPAHWDASASNSLRIPLNQNSKEFQEILQRFNATMKNCSRVIQIERIQNERWYKQYAAHREDHSRDPLRLKEELLFHGCLTTSTDSIIRECFNRSFAGVNGVVYGHGVYFHRHANYSHSYAKPDGQGRRTMFLARVLIGKTTKGNSSMKVPPPGYDSTTDGQDIFVVYHDAAAYAEYLITYQ